LHLVPFPISITETNEYKIKGKNSIFTYSLLPISVPSLEGRGWPSKTMTGLTPFEINMLTYFMQYVTYL